MSKIYTGFNNLVVCNYVLDTPFRRAAQYNGWYRAIVLKDFTSEAAINYLSRGNPSVISVFGIKRYAPTVVKENLIEIDDFLNFGTHIFVRYV